MNFLGIDVGATFIKHGMVDLEGRISREARISTPKSLEGLTEHLIRIIKKNRTELDIRAAGIGIAGFIRKSDQHIIKSPNMPFLDRVDFKEIIQKKTEIPVFMENDANLFALGEYTLLKPPRPRSFINITLGTGLGGGIILNGEIWQGEGGYASELGHVIVNPQGRSCGCGSRGCVETESTAIGIIQTYRELTGKRMDSSRDIFNLAEKEDKNAISSFNRAGQYLGIFLTSLINILNPAIICIGGGVALAGDLLFKPVFAELRARVSTDFLQTTRIMISTRKNNAGIIGAARYASEKISEVDDKKENG